MTDKPKRHRVKPKMIARARELRKASPLAERIMWGMLRNHRLAGLKFRRQHVVGHYVADYYCAEHRLVVELDGISHSYHVDEDRQRTGFLESQWLRVIRFTNHELLTDREAVGRTILREVGLLERFYTPAPFGSATRGLTGLTHPPAGGGL